MPPQNVHVLISGICTYATLYRQGDFADLINLRILEWGDYPKPVGSM